MPGGERRQGNAEEAVEHRGDDAIPAFGIQTPETPPPWASCDIPRVYEARDNRAGTEKKAWRFSAVMLASEIWG